MDYFILIEPRADGPLIGYYAGRPIPAAVVDYFGRRYSYAGRPIPAAVVDYFGRRYSYAGVAPRRHSGQYDVESLRPGEWIIEPGLVYRDIGSRH